MQVRWAPDDRARPSDSNDIIFGLLTRCSAIARSRKRKLCILYEVTVSPDALPRHSFSDLDAYEPTPAERRFLDGCDMLQYVLPSLFICLLCIYLFIYFTLLLSYHLPLYNPGLTWAYGWLVALRDDRISEK